MKTYFRRAYDRLIMQPIVHKMLLPFGNELEPQKWIFIIGSYNSGTTLLANILRKHKDIGGLPTEGIYLTDSLEYPEKHGWPRMWSQCLDSMLIDNSIDQSKRARTIKKNWSIWYPKDTPCLAEKSIANSVRMPFLDSYFKPAYFINIVRNGYAVSAGIRKKANLKRWKNKYQDDSYPIELCAKQWAMTYDIVDRDKENVENCLTIYYEDLVSDPVKELKGIMAFLDLKEMENSVIESKWDVHEKKSSEIRNMNEENIKLLSKDDIELINKAASKTLLRHGYKSL